MPKEVFEAFEGQQETFGYSQAVHVGDTIYVAGTLGVGEDFASPDDMGEQTKLAYANIADTLANFGAVRRTERHSVCHQSGAVGQLPVWERRSGTPL